MLLNKRDSLSKGCFAVSRCFPLCGTWSAKAACNCEQEWQGRPQTLLPWGALGRQSPECPSSPVLQGPRPQAALGLIIHKAGLRLSPLTPQPCTMLLLTPPARFQQSVRTLSVSIFIFYKCPCEGWTWPEPRLSSPCCRCLSGTQGKAVFEARLKARALASLPCCFSLLLACMNATVPSITSAGSAQFQSRPATQPGRT